MKKLLILPIALFLMASCGGNSNKPAADVEEKASVEDFSDIANSMADNSHSAKNALDYAGTYVGTVPNASGMAEDITIVLTEKEYTITVATVGNAGAINRSTGTYSWNKAGNTITLEGHPTPNQYFVGENQIFQTDKDGNRISGEKADDFILKKQGI